MVIKQVRIDLIDLHTTVDPLRGIGKNSNAAFSFLIAKRPYKLTYAKVMQNPVPIAIPPLNFTVGPVCKKNENNFWNGAWNRRYEGYIGLPSFSDVAWDKFLPFLVEMPLTIQPPASEMGVTWTRVAPRIYTWSCGWGVSIELSAEGRLSLEDLASFIRRIRSEEFTLHIGQDSRNGSMTNLLEALSEQVREHIFGSILPPLAAPLQSERFGPFFLIAIRLDPPEESLDANQLDEQSARLIYAATSQNPTWESYQLQKIREGFKIIDTHPGSFIFVDRMARLFWFPYLTDRQLGCYIENTKAATVMMVRLAEFVRLLIQPQRGPTLRANYPLRDLFQHALTNLEQFQSFYKNTNLKRLAMDLRVNELLQNGRSLLS